MDNFISKYLEYTSLQESPDNYHIWCAMSVVSACLRRQIWVKMGYFDYFPNMYVVLVSPPGKCRKSISISTAVDLAKDLPDIIISADSTTREALILELDKGSRVADINGAPYVHSSVTIISKELSVFLGVGNHDLLSLLTDLYDCPNRWEYKTKNKGINTINGVWLNMLAASTPSWLVGSIPVTAIGGGLTSRIIFVVEDNVRLKNPIPVLTDKELRLKSELTAMLEKIAMIKGEFVLSPDAFSFFTKWYMSENIKIDDERFSGYSERKHAHILKVSMILAACELSPNVIEKRHTERALFLLSSIEKNMMRAFGAVGRSVIAADIDEILRNIANADAIERNQLLRLVKMNIHPKEFDTILTMLKTTGEIREEIRAGKLIYSLTEKK